MVLISNKSQEREVKVSVCFNSLLYTNLMYTLINLYIKKA